MTSQVVEGFALSSICADDLGAHVFRHRVAAALSPWWRTRAHGLETCGEAGARLRCSCCSSVHVAPYRCGARSCPTCAHIASAVSVDKLAARVERAMPAGSLDTLWEGPSWPREKSWLMFTGTQQTAGAKGDDSRYEHAALLASIRRVRGAWGPFWRSTAWGARVYQRSPTTGILGTRLRRDVAFAMGIEVAPGGMVHLHAAIYGEYNRERDRDHVWRQWREAIGKAGFITVKPMKAATPDDFKDSLREVLKYVSKGERGERRALHAAAIERAMRQVRRVEMGGAIRGAVRNIDPLDLASHRQSCTDCGANEQWQWAGLRGPEYVIANGGFGLDTMERLRRNVKDETVRRDLRGARELGAEWAPELVPTL